MAAQRIGIFGGTFDPIHTTHIDVARTALNAENLDRVIFVVSARPPHKHEATQATPEQRLEMVEQAILHEPRMIASSIELRREGPSYTHETLECFAQENPEAEFFLILGMDALKDLPRWKNPDRILARAHLLVVPRTGEPIDIPESMAGRFALLPFEASGASSTEIRRRAASGEALICLSHPARCASYTAKGFTVSVLELPVARDYLHALESRLPGKTLRHVRSVAEFMASFSEPLGVSADQVAAAGLLHDYCKPMKPPQLLDEARRQGIEIREAYRAAPGLLHGPVAAVLCRERFNIDDAVHEAITWHTTGTPGLGPVGLALYVADYGEPLRDRPESDETRAILQAHGFLAALRYVADSKLRYVKSKGAMDPISEDFSLWVHSPACEAVLR